MKGTAAANAGGGLLGAPNDEPPKSRTQLWAALNRDQGLLKEVIYVQLVIPFSEHLLRHS